MPTKIFIDADALLSDSFELGMKIVQSEYAPDFIIALWRGGTPVGIAVQEVLEVCGIEADHISIRTSSYIGASQQGKTVRVHGLDYVAQHVDRKTKLLIVDDIFDTGKSIDAVINTLSDLCQDEMPMAVKVATPWYKPDNNQTLRTPDYYLNISNEWLVFPHEINGLSSQEIQANKPQLARLMSKYKVNFT